MRTNLLGPEGILHAASNYKQIDLYATHNFVWIFKKKIYLTYNLIHAKFVFTEQNHGSL